MKRAARRGLSAWRGGLESLRGGSSTTIASVMGVCLELQNAIRATVADFTNRAKALRKQTHTEFERIEGWVSYITGGATSSLGDVDRAVTELRREQRELRDKQNRSSMRPMDRSTDCVSKTKRP